LTAFPVAAQSRVVPIWAMSAQVARTIRLPDGQITSVFPKSCQAPFAKIFLFFSDPNQFTDSPRPVSTRGALRNVINAGLDAVDAGSALDEWC